MSAAVRGGGARRVRPPGSASVLYYIILYYIILYYIILYYIMYIPTRRCGFVHEHVYTS